MKDRNGSGKLGDGIETEPESWDVGIVVCGHGNWVDSVDLVMVGSQFEADEGEGAVSIVLLRSVIEKLSDSELVGDIVSKYGGASSEAEGREQSGDQNNGVQVGRVGPGDDDVGML